MGLILMYLNREVCITKQAVGELVILEFTSAFRLKTEENELHPGCLCSLWDACRGRRVFIRLCSQWDTS